MTSLILLACLVLLPGMITWGLARLLVSRSASRSRREVLRSAVPVGALLPQGPLFYRVATATNIDNAVPIAIAATLMVAGVVALLVCLPIGLAATRDLSR